MKNVQIIDETITWNRVQNKMTSSAADAPYLGATQPKGTVAFGNFVTAVKNDGCSESELEIRRVMTKQSELLKSYVAQNHKVYFPVGIAGVHLTKSFPTQDAPFDPSVNEAIMSIRTNDETRNSLAGVRLREDRAAAAVLMGPKINSVCTDGTRFGVIVGTRKFVVVGQGLNLDKTKPTDKLTLANSKTGAVTDVTNYTCDGEGFRIEAQLVTALAAGNYVLTVYVNGGDAENPSILSSSVKVTVEAGETPVPPAPTLTRVSSGECDEGEVTLGDEFVLMGTGLDQLDAVTVEAKNAVGETVGSRTVEKADFADWFYTETSTATDLFSSKTLVGWCDLVGDGDTVTFTVRNAGGSATLTLTARSAE